MGDPRVSGSALLKVRFRYGVTKGVFSVLRCLPSTGASIFASAGLIPHPGLQERLTRFIVLGALLEALTGFS